MAFNAQVRRQCVAWSMEACTRQLPSGPATNACRACVVLLQITRSSISKHTPVSVTRKPCSARPSKALIARAQPQGGAGDVCDPPSVYQQNPDAQKVVRKVDGEDGGREFDAPRIEQTIVQHEVERVKPVIHQEMHQTRLHEVTHHKQEGPRDMGITEVVQHGDTDPCGNPVTEDLNAIRGTGTLSASGKSQV